MTGDRIPVKILSTRIIPNVSPALRRALGLSDRHRAVGLISTDCDDATYIALDEATKAANVFCGKDGKQAKILSVERVDPFFGRPPAATITFKCE